MQGIDKQIQQMPSETSITHKKLSDRVYPLESNIIKIHNIFITKSLRFCMHHPWYSIIWNKASGKMHRPGNLQSIFPHWRQ